MNIPREDLWVEGAGRQESSIRGILLLSVLLCGVFFLAVGAYGMFAEDGGLSEGNLPGAVLVLRELVEENEAVSVFLGLEEPAATETGAPFDAEAFDRITAAAEAYIQERQP